MTYGSDLGVFEERTMQPAFATATKLSQRFAEGASERDRERTFPSDQIAALKASGLQALGVPRECGGIGATYGDRCRVVRQIAVGDSNIAQIFISHLACCEMLNLAASGERLDDVNRRLVQGKLWLANASSELGSRGPANPTLTLRRNESGWLLDGNKFYCTGSLAADEFLVYGAIPEDGESARGSAIVSARTPGLSIVDDWSGMGQRGTASGTVTFAEVQVPGEGVLDPADVERGVQSNESLFAVLLQSLLTAIYIGVATAALQDAREYVTSRARVWFESNAGCASEDPYVLRHVGRMQAYLEAAEALEERALGIMDSAAVSPSARARGEAMIACSEAKVVATEVALDICERLFQICGSSATVAKYNFDRHWRNVRTLSLHDPVDYKSRLVGEYVLNARLPIPTLYT